MRSSRPGWGRRRWWRRWGRSTRVIPSEAKGPGVWPWLLRCAQDDSPPTPPLSPAAPPPSHPVVSSPDRDILRLMRAMVLERAGGPLVARVLERPEAGAGQILVGVEACAVCRTDLH